jgi:hypothetical protein
MKILTFLGNFRLQIFFHKGDAPSETAEVAATWPLLFALRYMPRWYADFIEKHPSYLGARPHNLPSPPDRNGQNRSDILVTEQPCRTSMSH